MTAHVKATEQHLHADLQAHITRKNEEKELEKNEMAHPILIQREETTLRHLLVKHNLWDIVYKA